MDNLFTLRNKLRARVFLNRAMNKVKPTFRRKAEIFIIEKVFRIRRFNLGKFH